MKIANIKEKILLGKYPNFIEDRLWEVGEFIGHDRVKAIKKFHKIVFGAKIDTDTDNNLFKSYASVEDAMMVRWLYHDINCYRASNLTGYFKGKIKRLRVLDYGCGIGDVSLVFALLGAKVSLLDLDNKVLKFAVQRYKNRGMKPEKVFKANPKNMYPLVNTPNDQFDLVICSEVLEHLRNPVAAVTTIHFRIVKGGYFWPSHFPFEKKKGWTTKKGIQRLHLKEAEQKRETCKAFIEKNFVRVKEYKNPKKDYFRGFLFRKK